MSPDTSQWMKGLNLVVNAVPYDAGAWREVNVPATRQSVALPAGSQIIGTYSDPLGSIFLGTTRPAGPSARLYEFVPATDTLTNRTPGTDYGGSPARWAFTKFGASVIAAPVNDGSDSLVLQVRSGSGNFANLVTSADRPAPKFIATSHAHVVGAYNTEFGGAGVYSGLDPYQVYWSSRNNAAVWTPGVDAAGFVPVIDELGAVSGLMGFRDFFLLFQEFGVSRYTWVGGNFVWEAQAIGAHAFGISIAAWETAPVKSDRDCYYFSNSGPAIVRNGEEVSLVGAGSVRRFFMDKAVQRQASESDPKITFPLSRNHLIAGEMDPSHGFITWTATTVAYADPLCFQLVYHLATDRWSIIASGQDATGVALARRMNSTYPLDNYVLFTVSEDNLLAVRFAPTGSDSRVAQTIAFYSSRLRPETGKRIAIHGLRFLVLFNNPGEGEPTITLRVHRFADPTRASVDTHTMVISNRNEAGWIMDGSLPLEGAEFDFEVVIQGASGSGGAGAIREAPALEAAYCISSNDF